jgi:pyrroloquinoline quinone biosynthesis protein E
MRPRDARRPAGRRGLSIWVALEVTPRCSLSCPWCYNVWLSPGARTPNEPDTPDTPKVIEALALAPGLRGITLTGGEPLLRGDLPALAAGARKLGMAVAVATNGQLLDRKAAERLVSAGVSHFDIGLPTADPHAYRTLCGAGAGPARRAVSAAAGSGATVTVSVCVCRPTAGSLGETVEMAAALGADAVALNRFVPTGRGRGNRGRLEPSPAALSGALEDAGAAAGSSGIRAYAGVPLEPCVFGHPPPGGIEPTACVCGRDKWAVGPDGGLRLCEQSSRTLGSLHEEGFEALSSLPAVGSFRRDLPRDRCRSCPDLFGCRGGCRFLGR